ncbi:hypothetical protein L3X38_038412 [Prunus dulcis]|uniref:Reverse transcriptase zinc-binding domain-containing protein n=1 Tax=Prunus dulcis TaxID=3755 RepID=A0AAD4V580_PRUDU|nr:hypothetical protein L3X38_038412 [Prunus dulcis]
MVAKQAWRLLEKPNPLVDHIMKARYFPVGNCLSLVWRAIVWGRQVIDQGLVWRVSDGQSIGCFEINGSLNLLLSSLSSTTGFLNTQQSRI